MNRLLLVEDDNSLRLMLDWELSDQGFEVHPVKNCTEALQLTDTLRFDFALLDCGLPDGCGPSLLEQLQEIQPHIIAILMSGEPDRYHGRKRAATLSTELLQKPVSVKQLQQLFQTI